VKVVENFRFVLRVVPLLLILVFWIHNMGIKETLSVVINKYFAWTFPQNSFSSLHYSNYIWQKLDRRSTFCHML